MQIRNIKNKFINIIGTQAWNGVAIFPHFGPILHKYERLMFHWNHNQVYNIKICAIEGKDEMEVTML